MQADRGDIACAARAHWRPVVRPARLVARPTQWVGGACHARELHLGVVTVRSPRPTPYPVNPAERASFLVGRSVLPRARLQRLAHVNPTRRLFAHEEPASVIVSSKAHSPC